MSAERPVLLPRAAPRPPAPPAPRRPCIPRPAPLAAPECTQGAGQCAAPAGHCRRRPGRTKGPPPCGRGGRGLPSWGRNKGRRLISAWDAARAAGSGQGRDGGGGRPGGGRCPAPGMRHLSAPLQPRPPRAGPPRAQDRRVRLPGCQAERHPGVGAKNLPEAAGRVARFDRNAWGVCICWCQSPPAR